MYLSALVLPAVSAVAVHGVAECRNQWADLGLHPMGGRRGAGLQELAA